jgi:hypothetical protein
MVKVMGNKKVSDEVILDAYYRLHNIWKVGQEVGLCGQSVHERIQRLGIENEDKWSEGEISLISRWYTERCFAPRGEFSLEDLSAKVGKPKTSVCRKARELGLTNIKRRMSEDMKQQSSSNMKEWLVENEHPRGMLGKTHSDEFKKQLSERTRRMWAGECEAFLSGSSTFKGLQTKHSNGDLVRPRENVSWKGGNRTIGDKEVYFRSSWEFNYALYLELLKQNLLITEWEHEPDTYWFHNIQRGSRMYVPDFKIHMPDGSFYYVEVKGWMDSRSQTKLDRMEKYYPEHLVCLVQKNELKEIRDKYAHLLPDWEGPLPRKKSKKLKVIKKKKGGA